MLIVNIVNIVLFTSGICFVTNVVSSTGASVTATSTKLKRVVVDPGHNIRNNQEQSGSTKTTSRIPSPRDINLRSSPHYGEDNVKTTDIQTLSYASANQRPGSHAYGSVPELSYISSPVQIKSEQSRSDLLAPYFDILNNPDAYKTTRSVENPLDASKSIVSQSLQKLQSFHSPTYAFHQEKPIELPGFSDFEYPSYASINKLISEDVQNSAFSIQTPVYKMNYPLSRDSDYTNVYASSIPTVASVTPSSDKITQSPKQKGEVTVDINGKKISVPIIQLQSNLDFSGVFENQPFLLSANHPIESNVGFKLGTGPKFNMALQSSNVSPFSSPLSSFQSQVVPIQTVSGNPQFPLYKGASIEAYPVASNVLKGNYEPLYSQPQLHFDKKRNGNVQAINVRQNTVNHPSVSTQDILNDVEIINKKKPEPHTPQPDDDDDDDDDNDKDDEDRDDRRYKNPDKEHDYISENKKERQPLKYFKTSPTESNFKSSVSHPFKEYDERFGKHTAQSDDDDEDSKPYSSYKSYSSPVDDDEEEEDSSSEYHAESSKPSYDSYSYEEEEDEDEEKEEESHKQEKRKKTNDDSQEEPKGSKYYQTDFEQEFEESYREELPKQEYEHVKEVPEIESYISSSPSKQKNNNQSRVKNGQPKESRSQESRISKKNRKVPKTDYRDSIAYDSDISIKKAPKVIHQEFFVHKNPETKKYSQAKAEKFSSTKKLPKEDSYSQAAKHYKFKNLKTDGEFISKDKDPYSSTNNLKLNKNSPDKTVTRSNVRLSDPVDETSFYESSILSGQVRSLTNAEIFRDLTGI